MPSEKILIVDDERLVRWSLKQKCEEWGYHVLEAEAGEPGLKVAQHESPDLVLLDVRMPNVNGEQFCRFIKSNALFAGIKVLLCSGENEAELQRICREAGADGYVQKDALIAKVILDELT